MKNKKLKLKNTLLIITALLVITTCFPAFVFAESQSTTITGVDYDRSGKTSSTLKDSITISTNAPRKVELQLYNSSTKAYSTKVSFTTDANGAVTIVYPATWRKRTYSTWRIYVPATTDYDQFYDKPISLTSRNVKSVSLLSKSACLYCVNTGEAIYDKGMNTKRKQASTTKLMTALLILEQNKLNQKVRVSKSASKTPWRNLYMKSGDVYYVKQMLYALLLPSSNDAANVLAENNAGNRSKFVNKMNLKAKSLNLTQTHFRNAHGLDTANHYTTAYDLARLTSVVYKKKTFRKIIKTKKYSFRSLKFKKYKTVKSTDKLLGYIAAFKGGKTGYDDTSRYCFSGIYVYKGKTYIASTLGSKSSSGRFNDSKKLYKYIKSYGNSKY